MKIIGIFLLLVIMLPCSFLLGISIILMPQLAGLCIACYLLRKLFRLRRLTLRGRVR